MLFIALSIPEHVATTLETAAGSFASQLERQVPREQWHIILVWLRDQEQVADWLPSLTSPLSQAFLPTVSLRYAGRGVQAQQLWVYVEPTPMLLNLRMELITRLQQAGVDIPQLTRPWVPHIHVADFSAQKNGVLADRLLPATTFVPPAAHLMRDYIIEGTMSFS